MDSDGSIIVVAAGTSADTGVVIRVNSGTGAQTVLASGHGLLNPIGVAVQGNGDILIADAGNYPVDGGVFRIDHSSGALTRLVSGAGFFAILVSADGTTFVAGNDQVSMLDTSSGALTTISAGGSLRSIFGLDAESSGKLVVADGEAGKVIRIDPSTGDQTTVASGNYLHYPLGIAVWPDTPLGAQLKTWGGIKARYR